MEDDNVNLAEMSELFNNKTLKYRINGFAYACKMKNITITQNGGLLFTTRNDKKLDNCPNYYITVSTTDKDPRGKEINLNGYYEDLNFSFTNFCDFNDNLDRKVKEIPFAITLIKTIDNDIYLLQAETISGMETKFKLSKSREYKDKTISSKIVFYANVIDFSSILKLVKSFVYNPKLVFSTYNDVINSKKITLSNTDLNIAIMQDTNLDKPIGKTKKLINRIIG